MDSKKQAQGIASLGRYGDTTLMHMRPDEVAQLTAISRANGGDITINPKTGMPEAFLGDFIGAILPTAAGIGAGALFGPAGGAIAGGLTSFMQGKRDPLSIGLGALGGYGGANIATELGKVGATVPAAQTGSTIGASGTTTAATNAAMNTTGFNPALTTVGGQGIPVGSNFGSQALTTAGGRGVGLGPVNTVGGPANISGVAGSAPRTPIQTYASTQNLSPYTNQTTALQNQQQLGPLTENAALGEYPNYQPIKPDAGQAYKFQAQADRSPLQEGFEYSQSKFDELGRGTKAVFTDADKRSQFFKGMGDGSEGMGMFKTALPIAGAGAEAYMKGMYQDMPTYEQSTAGLYDPTRRLNLGMDTGLRLLAQGGEVKRYALGGTVPMGSSTTYPFTPYYMGGGGASPEEYGIVDVGGNFVKTSDKPGEGLMSKTSYFETYKFKDPDYTPEKQEDSSGGDFEARAGLQGAAGGINPAVALQAAQGYADTQQSDLNQQGLGGLRKGGAIRYQQGGKTTAEMNTAKAATPPPATTMDLMLAKKNEEEMAKQGIPAGLNIQAIQAQAQQEGMAAGGIAGLTPDDGKMLNGNGDGVSDEIPAMIEGEQEAALSDGEFIVPARIVSELGNGSSDAGAQKLYTMIDRIQAARSKTMGDNKEYAKDTNAERYLPA